MSYRSEKSDNGIVEKPCIHAAALQASALRGVRIPWTLALGTLLGASLMFTRLAFGTEPPIADSDHLVGALIVTVSPRPRSATLAREAIYTCAMARCVRMALLWLSLFALPLHGMAGVTTLVCLSDNDMALSTVGMQATSTSPGIQADHMASAVDLSNMSKVNCGGNAVCHASVALPATHFDVGSAVPATAPATFVPASVIGFLTGGPDRPPRSIFA